MPQNRLTIYTIIYLQGLINTDKCTMLQDRILIKFLNFTFNSLAIFVLNIFQQMWAA